MGSDHGIGNLFGFLEINLGVWGRGLWSVGVGVGPRYLYEYSQNTLILRNLSGLFEVEGFFGFCRFCGGFWGLILGSGGNFRVGPLVFFWGGWTTISI